MESLSIYRDLADCYDRLGQVSMRDRFLILAADAALEAGLPAEAERLRQRLLQGSRHHMLRPYSSFAEAASRADVQTYLRDLRLNYPHAVAPAGRPPPRHPPPATPPPAAPPRPPRRPSSSGGKPPPPAPAGTVSAVSCFLSHAAPAAPARAGTAAVRRPVAEHASGGRR